MLAGMVPLPRPPFLIAASTRASSGLTSSSTGPTRPLVPASDSVWQVPQDWVKISFPAALAVAPPPPPPVAASELPASPPTPASLSLADADPPPPPPVSSRLSPITIDGMVMPNTTMMNRVGIQNLRLNCVLPDEAPRHADDGRGGGY